MATPIVASKVDQRKRSVLSAALEKSLRAYALAGAAGLSVVCAPQADGAIHYTLAKVAGAPFITTGIDLNQDGISDFAVYDYFIAAFGGFQASIHVNVSGQNGVAVDGSNAHAFKFGDEIGPKLTFAGNATFIRMAEHALDSGSSTPFSRGEFTNTKNESLGLRFNLNGQTYYGWARVDIKTNGAEVIYELVDYAYQDVPGRPILAGQGIRENQRGSLGSLALGQVRTH